MKTYIKSILALATAALLGSSAWATAYEYTVEEGQTLHCDDVLTYGTRDRWWTVRQSGDASIAVVIFDRAANDPNQEVDALSGNHATSATFSVKGVKAGSSTTWTVYTYTDAGPYASGKPYPDITVNDAGGTGGNWSNGSGHTIKITVIESSKTKHNGAAQTVEAGKGVTLPDDIKTAWTAKSQAEGVATVTASGDAGAQPVVSGIARGETEVWVENSADRWVYPVKVWEQTIGSDSINVRPNADNTSVICTSDLAGTWTATSYNTGVATVSVSGSGTSVTPTIHGVSVGETTVTVKNDYATWTIAVKVQDKTQAEIFADILKNKTGNATVDTTTDENALILKYTTTTGTSSLTIPEGYGATARVLVVGGGTKGGDGS